MKFICDKKKKKQWRVYYSVEHQYLELKKSSPIIPSYTSKLILHGWNTTHFCLRSMTKGLMIILWKEVLCKTFSFFIFHGHSLSQAIIHAWYLPPTHPPRPFCLNKQPSWWLITTNAIVTVRRASHRGRRKWDLSTQAEESYSSQGEIPLWCPYSPYWPDGLQVCQTTGDEGEETLGQNHPHYNSAVVQHISLSHEEPDQTNRKISPVSCGWLESDQYQVIDLHCI